MAGQHADQAWTRTCSCSCCVFCLSSAESRLPSELALDARRDMRALGCAATAAGSSAERLTRCGGILHAPVSCLADMHGLHAWTQPQDSMPRTAGLQAWVPGSEEGQLHRQECLPACDRGPGQPRTVAVRPLPAGNEAPVPG